MFALPFSSFVHAGKQLEQNSTMKDMRALFDDDDDDDDDDVDVWGPFALLLLYLIFQPSDNTPPTFKKNKK